MRSIVTSFFLVLCVSGIALAGPPREGRKDDVQRLSRATAVFREIMRIPDKAIPEDLLDKAECVAIVPGLKKGGWESAAATARELSCAASPTGNGQRHPF